MDTKFDAAQIQSVLDDADCLYTATQVVRAIDEMARTINHRLKNRQVLCLAVMVGGLIPAGQLLPHLTIPIELDYVHATRYHSTTSGSQLQWLHYPRNSLQDRTILLIDDILDEGVTLQAIVEYCRRAGAMEVFTATLVEKVHQRRKGLQHTDFCGLKVPDRYVFGYGMDYQEQLRHTPGIYAIRE